MKETLTKAFEFVKIDEGEFSDDLEDNGGPTRLGITIFDYADWNHLGKVPQRGTAAFTAMRERVRNMSERECTDIYRAKYWLPVNADSLPLGLDYWQFDCGLLNGVITANRWLQNVVGVVQDGQIGPKTLAALQQKDSKMVLTGIETLRRRRLRSLPDWPTFGRGWTNRVNKAKARALKLMEAK